MVESVPPLCSPQVRDLTVTQTLTPQPKAHELNYNQFTTSNCHLVSTLLFFCLERLEIFPGCQGNNVSLAGQALVTGQRRHKASCARRPVTPRTRPQSSRTDNMSFLREAKSHSNSCKFDSANPVILHPLLSPRGLKTGF